MVGGDENKAIICASNGLGKAESGTCGMNVGGSGDGAVSSR